LLDKSERAMDFVSLDAGSDWTLFNMPEILLRQGQAGASVEAANNSFERDDLGRKLLVPCLTPRVAR